MRRTRYGRPRNRPRLSPEEVCDEVAAVLTDLERFFVPGTKLTFIARPPENPGGDRDFVVSEEDDIADAIGVLQRRAERGNEWEE